MFLAGNFLSTSSDTFAVKCTVQPQNTPKNEPTVQFGITACGHHQHNCLSPIELHQSSVQFSLQQTLPRGCLCRLLASLKRWVLSPAWNCWQHLVGVRRCGGSEFQTTGAATEKLRRPSLVVLIHGTNRSHHTAEWRLERPEMSATGWNTVHCWSRMDWCLWHSQQIKQLLWGTGSQCKISWRTGAMCLNLPDQQQDEHQCWDYL